MTQVKRDSDSDHKAADFSLSTESDDRIFFFQKGLYDHNISMDDYRQCKRGVTSQTDFLALDTGQLLIRQAPSTYHDAAINIGADKYKSGPLYNMAAKTWNPIPSDSYLNCLPDTERRVWYSGVHNIFSYV